ncbi:MAG: HD domain-containing protein [Eubacteriales bacterium]
MTKPQEFNQLITDILSVDEVQNMNNLKQHTKKCTLLEHSIYTAYLTYRVCDRFGLACEEAVRGAVLHDFRLDDDPEKKSLRFHGLYSEETASHYFNLTSKEKNIIAAHMWPFNFKICPKSKEAMVVCVVDTYCAAIEKLHLYNHTKTTREISELVLSHVS